MTFVHRPPYSYIPKGCGNIILPFVINCHFREDESEHFLNALIRKSFRDRYYKSFLPDATKIRFISEEDAAFKIADNTG